MAGASFLDDLEGMLTDAGFVDVRIQPKDESKTFIREWVPGTNIADCLISATIEAGPEPGRIRASSPWSAPPGWPMGGLGAGQWRHGPARHYETSLPRFSMEEPSRCTH